MSAPKRPKTAYLCFATEEQPKLKQAHPELRFADLAKLLGERWREMPEEQKEHYGRLAQQDKERYERELAAFSAAGASGSNGAVKPKRPMSGYMCFVAEEQPKLKLAHPELGFADLAKQLGLQWKEMPDEQKERYVMLVQQDKERYELELAAFNAAGGGRATKEANSDDSDDSDE